MVTELHIADLEREIESLRCAIFATMTADAAFAEKLGRPDFAERFLKLREDLNAIIPPSRVCIIGVAQKMQSGCFAVTDPELGL